MSDIDFKALFENAPGLYLILKPDLTIVAVSDSYLNATMTRREDIVGKGLFEVFPDNPNDKDADGVSNLSASLSYVLKNGEQHTMAVQKYDIRRPDGTFEERYWSPLNRPVIKEGKVAYIIHRAEDVTDFVKFNAQLKQQEEEKQGLRNRLDETEIEIIQRTREIQDINKRLLEEIAEGKKKEEAVQELNREMKVKLAQLEEVNEEMKTFTYSVSHDLRAPLRAISSFSGIILQEYGGEVDEECRRMLSILDTNARKMGQLIDDLLSYSRVGRTAMSYSEVEIIALANSVVDELKLSYPEVKAEVKLGNPRKVKCDPMLMKQALQNLLGNAIKYSSQKQAAHIQFDSFRENEGTVFFVKDNGAGFDMRYSKKLFNMFQRLHGPEEFEGTGVGLAIVQRIIQKHGGKVWAEGKVDEGATFYFLLPDVNQNRYEQQFA